MVRLHDNINRPQPFKVQRSFGISAGSSPARSTTKHTINLTPLFSFSDIERAFKYLRRRQFKKSFEYSKRFTHAEDRLLNGLGRYLSKTSPDQYWALLAHFSLDPYIGMKIKKSQNKYRPLLVPQPKDRIIFAAVFPKIKRYLKKELKRHKALGLGFSTQSETTECKQILDKIYSVLESGEASYVLKLDFKDFFSSIDRVILSQSLHKYFKTENKKLSFEFMKMSFSNDIDAKADFWKEFKGLDLRNKGIPQGLSFSPLVASFYALPLDIINREVSGCKSYRYIDDMLVLAPTKKKAMKVYNLIFQKSKDLELNLHPLSENGKTQLIDFKKEDFKFLGVGISSAGLYIPDKAIEDFKMTFTTEIVNNKTINQYPLQGILTAFERFAGGWTNHYKTICPEHFQLIEEELNIYLDKYIRKVHSRKHFFGNVHLQMSSPFKKYIKY